MLRISSLPIVLLLGSATLTLGQTSPTSVPDSSGHTSKKSNEFSQQDVNAAMERLRQRQRERNGAAPASTQPAADAGTWPESGEHTRLKTSQRKAEHISQCNQAIAALNRTAGRDKEAKAQLDESRALLDALRSCTLEQYRDATVECWVRNEAELKRQWDRWKAEKSFDGLFAKAVSTLRKNSSIRSVQLSSGDLNLPPVDPDGYRVATRNCHFEFVTEGGLVRVYDGSVRIAASPDRETITTADIDGSLPRNGGNNLDGFNLVFWPWACKWVTLKGVDGQIVVADSHSKPEKIQPPDFAAIQAKAAQEARDQRALVAERANAERQAKADEAREKRRQRAGSGR